MRGLLYSRTHLASLRMNNLVIIVADAKNDSADFEAFLMGHFKLYFNKKIQKHAFFSYRLYLSPPSHCISEVDDGYVRDDHRSAGGVGHDFPVR